MYQKTNKKTHKGKQSYQWCPARIVSDIWIISPVQQFSDCRQVTLREEQKVCE